MAYCRVSSADQKFDLDRQVARVVTDATKQGLPVAEVVTEIGSALNGRRRKLHRLLSDPAATVIVVEHRDRLARFGVSRGLTPLVAAKRLPCTGTSQFRVRQGPSSSNGRILKVH